MKTRLFTLTLLPLVFAGCSDRNKPKDTPPPPSPTLSERASTAAADAKTAAVNAKDAVAAKLVEWKLTPADIKADLEKSGRVVRDKTVAAGEKAGGVIDNARIVTVINGKLVTASDLSAFKINVDADQGTVTLTGKVPSYEAAGHAVALALDTEGVVQVIGLLRVEPAGETTSM